MEQKRFDPQGIAEQRKVCEAATPGHWYVSNRGYSVSTDVEFIALSRVAYPAALDALEASMQRETEKDATIARLAAERDAESEQIQEIGRFALEQQEATALCELFDAMCTVRAMCGSTIQCTENENEPTGAESEGANAK